MSAPQRIQLKRTKGWRKPEGAIVVSRPSKWGNRYRIGDVIVDPVNENNPIATRYAVLPDWLVPGVHLRQGIHRTYWQQVYHLEDAALAVDLFRRWYIFEGYDVSSLTGHDLACWCPVTSPCHADVLLELANPVGAGSSVKSGESE